MDLRLLRQRLEEIDSYKALSAHFAAKYEESMNSGRDEEWVF